MRREYRTLLRKFKEEVERSLGREVKVMAFGSVVEGRGRPSSDVDVLVIDREFGKLETRLEIYALARRVFGSVHPFELHLITPEEFENWYVKFIGKYEEIT